MISLSDDLSSLPTESSFQKLNTEIDRIFLVWNGEGVRRRNCETAADRCTDRGIQPDAVLDQDAWDHLSPAERALYDDPKMLIPDNLAS